jgi:hypothetical protein
MALNIRVAGLDGRKILLGLIPVLGLISLVGCGGVASEASQNADLEQGANGQVDTNKIGGTGGSGQSGSKGTASAGSGGGAETSGTGGTGGDSGGTGGIGGTGGDSGGTGGTGTTKPPASYNGKGFVVHEWGTDTVVVGSDGSLQPGLHHEEEDLPGFVYDRIKGGDLLPSVNVKMETPVTYFYADKEMDVDVQVDFPKGILTQWFPAVADFAPGMAFDLTGQLVDPYLNVNHMSFESPTCLDTYSKLTNGKLNWGKVHVFPNSISMEDAMPSASLDKFTWSYARQVAANPLRLQGVPTASGESEYEKFLFYRGLGNFELPLQVTSQAGGKLTMNNQEQKLAMGHVFVLNVGTEKAAFHSIPTGVTPGGTLSAEVPSLAEGVAMDTFVSQLATSVTDALDATGLYHDEALAMVHTWQRQWFRTPGVRVLYLMPQMNTETQIPLTISPKPDETLRVMMIRVEVIQPEQEQEDVAMLKTVGSSNWPQVKSYFETFGRFTEPRLRRALGLYPNVKEAQGWLQELSAVSSQHDTN